MIATGADWFVRGVPIQRVRKGCMSRIAITIKGVWIAIRDVTA